MKIIFTPIHGTGNLPIRRVLDEVGFKNVSVVKEQEMPDSNFSTVKYPNSEENVVFDIAIEMAKKDGADIIIGTDPDCDRVGVVVKDNRGEYIVLNGNQAGSLLVYYVLSNKIEEIKTMNNPMIVKTIVTSELGAEIANIKVSELKDYSQGIDNLPKSDVLKFILEDSSWIAVRPSGTEPKIKFYFGCNGKEQEEVDDKLEEIMKDITNRVNS